jgi:hypothetical protein
MPFSPDDFFAVFARHNAAIWPLQILAHLAGVALFGLVLRRGGVSARIVLPVLAVLWLLNGIGYHLLHFSAINPLAPAFAALFIAEAVALALAARAAPGMVFEAGTAARKLAALALMVFALALYPLWSALGPHPYPASPAFGVAPCPTAIFTIGMLLPGPFRKLAWLLLLPGLRAAIGGSAAVLLQVPQDFGLIAALAILLVVAARERRPARP